MGAMEIPRGVQMSNRYLDLVKGARPFGHASRRTVMLLLAEHSNAEGRCWPSVRLLQHETELSKRTLLRCLSDLENEDWIAVERKSFGAHMNGNQYVVNSKKLVAYQRSAVGDVVAPVEGEDERAEVTGATVTSVEQVAGAIVTSAGATVTPLQVPKATFVGAKTASLYRRTPKNPHRNPQGGTHDENKPSASSCSRSETFNETTSDCAKVFFDRIGAVAPKSTLELAAGVIGILARESNATPLEGMQKLEAIAKKAQAQGMVINHFWLADSKWRGALTGTRPDATVGMRKDVQAIEPEALPVPAGADTELGRSVWEGMKKAIKAQIGPQSFETWVRPIKPLGVLEGELYLQLPSPEFEHVPGQYEISNYLPPTMRSVIHVTTAREYGAA